jgi:hypothetical protein
MPQFRREETALAHQGAGQPIANTVTKCARCGGYHEGLLFRPFAAGPMKTPAGGDEFGFWALCPVNGEPILAKVAEADHG